VFLRDYFVALLKIAGGLAIPLVCLLAAWFNVSTVGPQQTRRERLPATAFQLAVVGFIFAFASLVRISVLNTPLENYWILVNCLSVLCWLSVIVLVLIGKGKARIALGLWCVFFPVFVGIVCVVASAH